MATALRGHVRLLSEDMATKTWPCHPAGPPFDRRRKKEGPMSARIVSYKDYVAGWLDSSVHDFLGVLSPRAASTKYALITCLDSNPDPASLRAKSPESKPITNKLETVGTGLLLPTKLLLEADSRQRIFLGFDEVWFFSGKGVRPKPHSASLVGPARLNRARLAKIGKWMADNSCSLASGGGEGLNFVVRARGLVRFGLSYSIEQPEPTLVSA
jgi:hypothetical protein